MTKDEQCRAAIMRRVRLIYLARQLTSPLVLEAALFVVLATVINLSVSIPAIWQNITQLSYASEGVFYILDAAWRTELKVQIVLAACIVVSAFIGREIYRNVRNARGVRMAKLEAL